MTSRSPTDSGGAARWVQKPARPTGMVSGTTKAHAAGYRAGVAGTEAAGKGVIFRHFGTAPTRGTGTDGGHPGSVDRRDVDAQSRGLVQALSSDGHHQESKSAFVPGHRRRRVKSFRAALEGEWPYLWLDATYLKVRKGGRRCRSS